MTTNLRASSSGDHPIDPKAKGRIEEFLSLEQRVAQDVDTLRIIHHEAYTQAARAVLQIRMTDGRTVIDYSMLKDEDTAEQFADLVMDNYATALHNMTGYVVPTDKLGRSLWVEQFAGISGSEIYKAVRTHKERYTFDQHVHVTVNSEDSATAKVSGKMMSHAIGNAGLSDDDIPAMVNYMHASELLDATKLKFEEAVNLLMRWRRKSGDPAERHFDRSELSSLRAYKRHLRAVGDEPGATGTDGL